MKKLVYSLILLSSILVLDSCSKNEQILFEGEFIQIPSSYSAVYPKLNDGESIPSEFPIVFGGNQFQGEVSYTFEIDTMNSTAVEGFHYEVLSNTGTINGTTLNGEIPINILDDNFTVGESVSIIIEVVSSTADIEPNFARGEFIVGVSCELDLTCSYTFRNFDNFSGEEQTGSGTFSIYENTPGQYIVEDFSFGTWPQFLDIDPPTGSLRFIESNCGAMQLTGTDNFGDTWEMTDVLESNGPDFTFKYANSYGDFGTVTLTRTDGTTWPPLRF